MACPSASLVLVDSQQRGICAESYADRPPSNEVVLVKHPSVRSVRLFLLHCISDMVHHAIHFISEPVVCSESIKQVYPCSYNFQIELHTLISHNIPCNAAQVFELL